jgi:hypothetical protein
MSIFKKNTVLLDLLNRLSHMENKIDVIDNKFESIRLLDGCCDCKNREAKLLNDLKEFLENKLLIFKDSLLQSIQKNKEDEKEDNSTTLKNIIEETCNLHSVELNKTFEKCTSNNTLLNTNLFKSFENNLGYTTQFLKNFKNESIETQNLKNIQDKEHDLLLRTDLQTFLVGLQTNILNNQDKIYNNVKINTADIFNLLQKLLNYQNDNKTSDLLQNLYNLSENINDNVKSFYYDNEIIKHQIILEEDIQKYNDEIDNVRILAVNAKNSIQETLANLQQELCIQSNVL